MLAAGTGATLGLVVHPYSPLTLETVFTYVQIFRIGLAGVGASGFELGNEIYPYPLPVFFDIRVLKKAHEMDAREGAQRHLGDRLQNHDHLQHH